MTAEVFLFCHDVLMLNEYIKERIQTVSRPRIQELNIFSYVRTLAPIASQTRRFPPRAGEAGTKEKVIKFYYFVYAFPDIPAHTLFLVLFTFYPLRKNNGKNKKKNAD